MNSPGARRSIGHVVESQLIYSRPRASAREHMASVSSYEQVSRPRPGKGREGPPPGGHMPTSLNMKGSANMDLGRKLREIHINPASLPVPAPMTTPAPAAPVKVGG